MESPSSEEIEKCAQRSFLRKRYLQTINNIKGKDMQITFIDKLETTAVFSCMDLDGQYWQVDKLKSLLGPIPSALLRSTDISAVEISCNFKPNSDSNQ
jgi:hypothetical protein